MCIFTRDVAKNMKLLWKAINTHTWRIHVHVQVHVRVRVRVGEGGQGGKGGGGGWVGG